MPEKVGFMVDSAAPQSGPEAPFPAQKLVIGVCGAVGAVAVPSNLVWMRGTLKLKSLRVIMTRQATTFLSPQTMSIMSGTRALVDWSDWQEPTVPHMTLSRWADAYIVMPTTANMLAKVANGIADDLLTTCLLAAECPVFFVPTMNRAMWEKKVVQRNVRLLEEDGHHIIQPAEGYEISGNRTAFGSMPPVSVLMESVGRILNARNKKEPAGELAATDAGPSPAP